MHLDYNKSPVDYVRHIITSHQINQSTNIKEPFPEQAPQVLPGLLLNVFFLDT